MMVTIIFFFSHIVFFYLFLHRNHLLSYICFPSYFEFCFVQKLHPLVNRECDYLQNAHLQTCVQSSIASYICLLYHTIQTSNTLKALWEKKKMLVASSFSLTHNVFKCLLIQGCSKSWDCYVKDLEVHFL